MIFGFRRMRKLCFPLEKYSMLQFNAEKLLFCLVLSLNNAMIKRDIVHKDLVNKMDMYRLTITSSHKRQQRSNEIVFHEKSYYKPCF